MLGPTPGPVWGTAAAPRGQGQVQGQDMNLLGPWLYSFRTTSGEPSKHLRGGQERTQGKARVIICGHQADQNGGGVVLKVRVLVYLVVTEKMGIPILPP